MTDTPFVIMHRAHIVKVRNAQGHLLDSKYVTDVSFVHLGETYGARLPQYNADPVFALNYVAQRIHAIEKERRNAELHDRN